MDKRIALIINQDSSIAAIVDGREISTRFPPADLSKAIAAEVKYARSNYPGHAIALVDYRDWIEQARNPVSL